MLLKKQTVWLLTMLSLVVVLSVYYITSPEQKSNELATVKQEEKADQKEKQKQILKQRMAILLFHRLLGMKNLKRFV